MKHLYEAPLELPFVRSLQKVCSHYDPQWITVLCMLPRILNLGLCKCKICFARIEDSSQRGEVLQVPYRHFHFAVTDF